MERHCVTVSSLKTETIFVIEICRMLERAHCVNPVHCGNVLVTHSAVTEKHLTKSNKSNKSYFYLKLFFLN